MKLQKIENTKEFELLQAKERNLDIQKIETDAKKLVDIYKDFQNFIIIQQEEIDKIEMNTDNSIDLINWADKELITAELYQNRKNKLILCASILAGVTTGLPIGLAFSSVYTGIIVGTCTALGTGSIL